MSADNTGNGKRELDLLVKAVCEYAGITTNFVNPPIPPRNNDWCAYYEGREEDSPKGWGETQAAAIRDLVVSYPDDRPGKPERDAALGEILTTISGQAHAGALIGGQAAYEACLKISRCVYIAQVLIGTISDAPLTKRLSEKDLATIIGGDDSALKSTPPKPAVADGVVERAKEIIRQGYERSPEDLVAALSAASLLRSTPVQTDTAIEAGALREIVSDVSDRITEFFGRKEPQSFRDAVNTLTSIHSRIIDAYIGWKGINMGNRTSSPNQEKAQ